MRFFAPWFFSQGFVISTFGGSSLGAFSDSNSEFLISLSLKEELMERCLAEALAGDSEGEVPCGALVCDKEGRVLASDHNRVISLKDPTAHAEILSIRKAALLRSNYRLEGLLLFSTVEPCPMCLSAILHARLWGLVYGAPAPKWGAVDSLMSLLETPGLNHRLSHVESGVLKERSSAILVDFFQKKRKKG
jgi:tRNA(adenine34) deaminase